MQETVLSINNYGRLGVYMDTLWSRIIFRPEDFTELLELGIKSVHPPEQAQFAKRYQNRRVYVPKGMQLHGAKFDLKSFLAAGGNVMFQAHSDHKYYPIVGKRPLQNMEIVSTEDHKILFEMNQVDRFCIPPAFLSLPHLGKFSHFVFKGESYIKPLKGTAFTLKGFVDAGGDFSWKDPGTVNPWNLITMDLHLLEDADKVIRKININPKVVNKNYKKMNPFFDFIINLLKEQIILQIVDGDEVTGKPIVSPNFADYCIFITKNGRLFMENPFWGAANYAVNLNDGEWVSTISLPKRVTAKNVDQVRAKMRPVLDYYFTGTRLNARRKGARRFVHDSTFLDRFLEWVGLTHQEIQQAELDYKVYIQTHLLW